MQHLNTLWQLVGAASSVAELARGSQTYHFAISTQTTFYLHVAQAEVKITRWQRPTVEANVSVQAPFGWRLVTDQDADGVYMVARHRPVVGALTRARFDISLPRTLHLSLRLDECSLSFEEVSGTLNLPPF